MESYQGVFKRCEKKYLLNEHQLRELCKVLNSHMTLDDYGAHTISNVYLDTDDWALIRASVEKPLYKEKLRLRSYGIPSAEDPVFLELKKKFDGTVYKRRTQMTLTSMQHYLTRARNDEPAQQILNEISWFMDRYNPTPKVFIAYERRAYCGNHDPALRVTFDTGIRYRETALELSKGTWGTPILPRGTVLMEIKIAGAMPMWLGQALSQQGIFPTSFSKYGYIYQNYLSHDSANKGGTICA